ncbi:Dmx-like protein [Thalictrum thalictroides]|uniref:Dmx-like protein n=1 Tax=Thalictrum thalictroides TaxID=46969 RepID=A0A7J6WM68_THATH|nr:Dmx-like protein [Thalictrum thalictroides]
MASRGSPSNQVDEISDENELLVQALPLQLIRPDIIPPSPNRGSESTIDWLEDYLGFSWIAYAASSLLVISHFPSPLSSSETVIGGPIYHQTIELSNHDSSVVKALAWSPSLPSHGEIAVAIENCICLCSDTSANTPGSFSWIQVAVLVQSYTVEAISWTGSGDGLISVGMEVVLWKRNGELSWELAGKFAPEQPQAMVSATWSIGGPVATNARSRCVLVSQMDEKARFLTSQLSLPQPVSMIQWRPCIRLHSHRDVLLTCCLDGTVRLWSEIDDGRAKHTKQAFHVIAVIEINQSLKGALGKDTFVSWAAEIRDMTDEGGGINCPASEEPDHNIPGRCEWLISYGPQMFLTFWAIHCLDDISPLRLPRVTQWKTLDLAEVEGHHAPTAGNLKSKDHSLFMKAVISRRRFYGPPIKCSLLQLLPDNSMGWLQLHSIESSNPQVKSLSLDGHTGNLLQVTVHPYVFEVELAVSLDSNGLLFFWSPSTISNSILGIAPLALPTWKLVGKVATKHLSCVEYSCLKWAPSILKDYSVLLLGHSKGIDCFMIEIAENEVQKIVYHKLCTIPFIDHKRVNGPISIFAIPLPSTCRKTFISNHFMLLGLWANEFQAFSWEVTLHSNELSGSSCDCNFDVREFAEITPWRYESSFAGKRYCLVAEPCSSTFPDSHCNDQVTSVAVISPDSLMPSVQQKWSSYVGPYNNSTPYHMATGYSDGSVRLWRSTCSKLSPSHSELAYLTWELVGMFHTHHGPVTVMSLSSCGGKIATISSETCPENISTLCVWQSVRILNAGSFLLEDEISLSGCSVALSWFSIGSGHLLLGVCMQNELRIYAQRSFGSQTHEKSGELLETHIWYCIATGSTCLAARNFLWGPGASPIVLHERYFCLFSKWSYHTEKKHQTMFYVQCTKDNSPSCLSGADKDFFCAILTDCNYNINKLSLDGISEKGKVLLPPKLNVKIDYPVCNLFSSMVQRQYNSGSKIGLRSILAVSGKLRGSLPIYHPEALLQNLYSGHWRRACVSVRHLVEYLTSDSTSVACDKAYDSIKHTNIIPQILLSKYFEEPFSTGLSNKGLVWGGDATVVSSDTKFQINSFDVIGHGADGSSNAFNSGSMKSEISWYIETIQKFNDIATITSMERVQMLAVIDLLDEICDSSCASAYESLDEPGRRFWVAIRFQQLHFLRRFGKSTKIELVVDSGMIAWAFQSDCQDSLLTNFLSNEPSWDVMRNLGVGFWFTNATPLRTRMERLARSQYLKKKDPKDCALLYVALNRLQVLAGLFKISKDEKDKPLVGFLSRNFQDEKNKGAALKNAYVLMGRHQLELAVAFFLLGGDSSSAVSVCAKNLGDEQLALIICRLIEGDGGSLERHLISEHLLPAAVERRDWWLASLFEWTLGNYAQSFVRLLGFKMDPLINKSVLPSNQASFLDPMVGQYCLVLATKSFMKNYIGESAALVLARWAVLMTSIALNRRGLPIEALQCFSSSLSTTEVKDEGCFTNLRHHGFPHGIFEERNDAYNWLSGDVAMQMEANGKMNLALQYISNLIMEHPSWTDTLSLSLKSLVCNEEYMHCQYNLSLESFQHKLIAGLATFEQKYSLKPVDILNMILVYSRNNGTLFLGYHILQYYTSREFPLDENHTFDSVFWYHPVPKLFLKANEEASWLFARFLMGCSVIYSLSNFVFPLHEVLGTNRSHQLHAWSVYMRKSLQMLDSFKVTLKMYSPSFLSEDLMRETFTVIDLFEYYIIFTLAWLQKNLRGLILAIHPILSTYSNGHTPSNVDMENLKKHLFQNVELMIRNSHSEDVGHLSGASCKQWELGQSGELLAQIPDDEKWQILGACLWKHLLNFCRDLLKFPLDSLTSNISSRSHVSRVSSLISNGNFEYDKNFPLESFVQAPKLFAKLLENTLACITSCHAKQFATVLSLELEKGNHVPTLLWLQKSERFDSTAPYNCVKPDVNYLEVISSEIEASLFRILWEMSVDPMVLRTSLSQEKMSWLLSVVPKLSRGWTDVDEGFRSGYGKGHTINDDQEGNSRSSANGEGRSPGQKISQGSSGFLRSKQKDSTLTKEVTYFQSPKDIFMRSGELLEAICINSINAQQVAVASNQKGILFIERNDDVLSKYHSEFIWSEVDWPQNGWAGSESTPIPTFVSPGIGDDRKKGAHLWLGGASIGFDSFTRFESDLTGGRAYQASDYGGVGSSGLGWGTQEDFEFVDPPATVDNISTRAFSSHPSRPFFLAGSSNTHIYLWEFGKEKATATYGVLPAASVPPPYALASIAALQFEHCGHRFVTAALDGTICTWQLEVGGRSNIRPTESSLCFNRHAMDVTYVAASGSVIAAAGYSSNDVNVVIWDTLAPNTTSQASLICHEGGARSVSVFDNNFGSGSISPLIVTGGKSGDVGLHDFRFIATGKTKRHKHSNSATLETQSGVSRKFGEQHSKGMLWYIPKAHLGSVVKIATVPNTSFFLTGSKDGDVKLWDAKKAELVFHWPKLHERHTFLQPSSRGFGGIVRAGVTDIQVLPQGFLTCGGDGSVKMVQIKNFP